MPDPARPQVLEGRNVHTVEDLLSGEHVKKHVPRVRRYSDTPLNETAKLKELASRMCLQRALEMYKTLNIIPLDKFLYSVLVEWQGLEIMWEMAEVSGRIPSTSSKASLNVWASHSWFQPVISAQHCDVTCIDKDWKVSYMGMRSCPIIASLTFWFGSVGVICERRE